MKKALKLCLFSGPFIAILTILIGQGWPLQQNLHGSFSYKSGREKIIVDQKGTYRWLVKSNSDSLVATGTWFILDEGWSGFWGRSLNLNNPIFYNSAGKEVEAGAAHTLPMNELGRRNTKERVDSFVIQSWFGSVTSLSIYDYKWIRE